MAFLHRTRLFVNDLLSPFGFAINRVEKQPSKCFRTTVSIQERAQLYETSTGRYYLPTDAPQDWVISCIKSGGVFEPEVVETAKAYIWPGSTSARCWREFRPNVTPLFAIRRCRRTGTFLRGGSFCLRTPSKNSGSEQLPECNGSPRCRL